jgi:glycosidase
MDDFQEFMDDARSRGMKVIIDYVMNHTSDDHPWFINSASGTTAEKRNWYRWSDTNPGQTGPWGQQVWFQRPTGYFFALFDQTLPDLNYHEAAVQDTMFSIADYWLEDIGVDGFRLDAAKHIFEENSKMENVAETYQLWSDFNAHYKQTNPEAFAVGEVVNQTEVILDYVKNDRLDHCFEFDLAGNILNTTNFSNATSVRNQMQKVYSLYPHLEYGTFLSNHDNDRVFNMLGNIPESKVAAAIYLTLPGVPYLYYGEEIGMKGEGEDIESRRPMQWNAGNTAGFTTGTPWTGLGDSHETFNVAVENLDPNSLLNWYRKLIFARNSSNALKKGLYKDISSNNPSRVYSFLRQYDDERVIVLINTSPVPVSNLVLDLDDSDIEPGNYLLVDLLSPGADVAVEVTGDAMLFSPGLGNRETKIFRLAETTSTKNVEKKLSTSLYPNPSRTSVQIRAHTLGTGNFNYSVYDINGRLIVTGEGNFTGGEYKLDTEPLQNGIYIISLEMGGTSEKLKFIKL